MTEAPTPPLTPEQMKAKAAMEAGGEAEKSQEALSRLREAPKSRAHQPVPETEVPPPPESDTVQIDLVTLLKIELLSTQQKLNKAQQQNLELTLLDLRREERAMQAREAQMVQEISTRLNLPPGKSLRLVDRQKGLCKVE